ncbi:MAG TPA: hypothetical protein PK659_09285 [Methanothrix sp.]|nr:hypothetical protein [Methanothrix sp.]HOK07920.1 hypothetical protein [Syntrophales bacterium]HOL44431.1 hypothetical protein [Methanothrix sp.]
MEQRVVVFRHPLSGKTWKRLLWVDEGKEKETMSALIRITGGMIPVGIFHPDTEGKGGRLHE